MGIKQIEAAILAEAKTITGNKKLRMKDIMEWSTGNVDTVKGERRFYLPTSKVTIAILENLVS